MKWLVLYAIDRYFEEVDGPSYRPEGHTIIVQADNKVQAFVVAFEQLTAQGLLVCTTSPLAGCVSVTADGDRIEDWQYAGLGPAEMEEVYRSGVPRVGGAWNDNTAMTRIRDIREFPFEGDLPQSKTQSIETNLVFVDADRIGQLQEIRSPDFDLAKLIELCKELNSCYARGCFLSVAMLGRAILDHVPPIFGLTKFSEVANNYKGAQSFKKSMKHLDNSLRNIADYHLHVQIRSKESLPTGTQVNFSADLDVLLAEIVRLLI